MRDPLSIIAEYGLAFVFANVLVEQMGAPIPAVPTLVVSGALAAQGELSAWAVFAIAILACTIGDGLWYAAGRRHGVRILGTLCKVSLSPDSCVRRTENQFARWGLLGLVLGKFIPGVSALAPPLAGAMKVGWGRFLAFNTLGAALWSGTAMVGGMIFHRQIAVALDRFDELGARALEIVAVLVAAYVAFRWSERRRFLRTMSARRIEAAELRRLMDEGQRPLVVDVRSATERDLDARFIPGALAIDLPDVESRGAELQKEREIVFYCSCPNEASAAMAARQLVQLGYAHVRPLLGGLEAWVAAGYEVERRGRGQD